MFAMLTAMVAWYWGQIVRAFQVTLGIFVDSGKWMLDQHYRRRISTATTSHRLGRENTKGVWETIQSNEDSEFGMTPVRSHRDNRGWRYAPAVWSLLERIWDEQESRERSGALVESLLKQIRWMFANPPLAVTEHGAVRSEYRAVTLWQEMSAA